MHRSALSLSLAAALAAAGCTERTVPTGEETAEVTNLDYPVNAEADANMDAAAPGTPIAPAAERTAALRLPASSP